MLTDMSLGSGSSFTGSTRRLRPGLSWVPYRAESLPCEQATVGNHTVAQKVFRAVSVFHEVAGIEPSLCDLFLEGMWRDEV